jgi:hypothetical protein
MAVRPSACLSDTLWSMMDLADVMDASLPKSGARARPPIGKQNADQIPMPDMAMLKRHLELVQGHVDRGVETIRRHCALIEHFDFTQPNS